MRVIGGTLRRRVLEAPRGAKTRPTSDRLRETLFNVLATTIPGSRFADLFAGSGAVGIEALSRGAQSLCLVEQDLAATASIRSNLRTLGLTADLLSEPVARALTARHPPPGAPWNVVFLDPPYEAAEDYSGTLHQLSLRHTALLAANALVVAEHARRSPLPGRVGLLQRYRVLEQGDAALSFYRLASEATASPEPTTDPTPDQAEKLPGQSTGPTPNPSTGD